MSGLVRSIVGIPKMYWVDISKDLDQEDEQARANYQTRTGTTMKRCIPLSSGTWWKVTLVHFVAFPVVIIAGKCLQANGVNFEKLFIPYTLTFTTSTLIPLFKQARNAWELNNHPTTLPI
jgi:hypothetical protein